MSCCCISTLFHGPASGWHLTALPSFYELTHQKEVPSWYKVGQTKKHGKSIRRVYISVPRSVYCLPQIVAYSYQRLTNVIWHVWWHSALDQRTLHDQTWRCQHSRSPSYILSKQSTERLQLVSYWNILGILCAMTFSLAIVWLDVFGHKDPLDWRCFLFAPALNSSLQSTIAESRTDS